MVPTVTPVTDALRRVWFTPLEVQLRTGVGRTTIYAAQQTGELEGNQQGKGRGWRVHIDACDAWMGKTAKRPA